MKRLFQRRYKKVLGMAVDERAVLVAEVVAGANVTGGGGKPIVRRLAQFVCPQGISLSQQPMETGKALGEFLQSNGFALKIATVVALPAKWLLARTKSIPPADSETRADMLRLQAESEFSVELKDLVYDYAGGGGDESSNSVLLLATPRTHVQAAVTACQAARLVPVSVTASSTALAAASTTGAASAEGKQDAMILSIGSTGGELVARRGASAVAVRHLGAGASDRAFVGELRRAISTMPTNGTTREMILWDAAGSDVDAAELARSIGLSVRGAELASLGVSPPATTSNGEARRYVTAVAAALAALDGATPAVDFLHPRLAPARRRRVPRWASMATLGAVALIAGAIFAYTNLQNRRAELAVLQDRLTAMQPEIKAADAFVSKVTFAQAWHNSGGGNEARYLACLRDLTLAMPEDGQTFATSLVIREATTPHTPTAKAGGKSVAAVVPPLTGQLYGKTSDQQHVQTVLDRLKRMPALSDVKLGGTQDAGRGREVTFSITFSYRSPRAYPSPLYSGERQGEGRFSPSSNAKSPSPILSPEYRGEG